MGLTVEKCLQAWTNSLRQMNAKADIVFFGDSLTYYGDFSSVFPDKVVCNLGLRGDTIQGMIDRVGQVAILKPDKVYVMAGINDVAAITPLEFNKKYDLLICTLLAKITEAQVVVQNLLPVNHTSFNVSCTNKQICEINEKIVCLSKKYGLTFVDLYSAYEYNGELPLDLTIDGIHLKQNSYHKWYIILNNLQKT